jgi:hypothetical protein
MLGSLDTAVLDETAVIIIKRLQRFLDRGARQEHRLTHWSIIFPVLLAYHHGIDRVRLEIPAVVLMPVLQRPILIIGRQPRDPHACRLQLCGPRRAALPVADRVHPSAHRHLFASRGLRPGILGHGHVRFCRHDTGETLRVQPPGVCTIPKP